MLTRNFRRLTSINLIFTFALHLISPILGPYIKLLGYTNFEVSLIYSLFPLTVILVLPLIGDISDKIGKKRIITLGVVIQILAFVLYLVDTYYTLFFLARIFEAIAAATFTIITLAKLEDGIKDKNRGQLSGLYLSIGHIGRIVAPLLGGLLADYYFIKFPFFVSILIFVGLLMHLFDKKEFHFKKIHRKDFNLIKDIKFFLSFRELRIMALLGIVAQVTLPAVVLFLPLFVILDLNSTYLFLGFALFLNELPHLFQGFFGKFCDGGRTYECISLGLILYGLGFIGLFYTATEMMILPFVFLMGFGGSIWNVAAWTMMSKIGENQKREGLILATYTSIAKIGSFFSYFISAIIVDMFSFNFLSLVNGVMLISISTLAYLLFKIKQN